jgi:hypothetical protein
MQHGLNALAGLLLLAGAAANASTITFNLQIELDESQIYDCGGSADPSGTDCWTNNLEELNVVTPQVVGTGDKVRVRLHFLGPYRLRWADDGIAVATFGDESVQVGAWSSAGSFGYTGQWNNSLAFSGVSGDFNIEQLAWSMSGSSGGLVSQSYQSEVTNLTDSSFAFSGIVAEMGPFGGTGLPQTIDRVAIFFTSGLFSIEHVPVPVAAPAPLALFGLGLAALGFARRKLA